MFNFHSSALTNRQLRFPEGGLLTRWRLT